jgi:serine/threonine protein phosphatase PrpC
MPRWVSATASDVGCVRSVNEDAWCERPEIGLWAVADGLGGHSAGDVASRAVVDALARLRAQPELSQMVEFVEHALEETNMRLRALASDGQTIGSTVVVLAIVGGYAAYLWVGDSRLYRLRGAELRQLTTDHSQVERYIEQGLLRRVDAAGHPQGHLLTRAIGAREQLRVDVDVCAVLPGDRFLLSSDGLEKHIGPEELPTLLAGDPPTVAAKRLVELTLERGATDNVTVCIVDIQH